MYKRGESQRSTGLGALLRPTTADYNVYANLFMNNASSVVAMAGAIGIVLRQPFKEMPVDQQPLELIDVIIFSRIIPGMVPTILFGSLYYAWMAVRKCDGQKHAMCALPYGVNTVAASAFVYNIMMPALDRAVQNGSSPKDAVEEAWRTGVVANMVAGLIAVSLAPFGNLLVKAAPTASLMTALAGIGFTWLGIAFAADCFAFAPVGLLTIALGIGTHLGSFNCGKVPAALVLLLVGSILGWMSGVPWAAGGDFGSLQAAAAKVGFQCPWPYGFQCLGSLQTVLSRDMGVILPVAFTGAVGTVLNVNNAALAGDAYPLCEALCIDGLTTIFAAICGSPLGTCVFIGHKVYKEQGGKAAYPILFAVTFAVFAMAGMFNLFASLAPPYAYAPVLLFIGLMISTDAMSFSTVPREHLPACMFGLMPAVVSWAYTIFGAPPVKNIAFYGLTSMAKGSLMLCLIWSAVFVYMIDGQTIKGAGWCLGAALLSAVGLIHQSQIDLTLATFTESISPYPEFTASGGRFVGTRACDFTLGYCTLALFFGFAAALDRCNASSFRFAAMPRSWERVVDDEQMQDVVAKVWVQNVGYEIEDTSESDSLVEE